MKLGRAVMAGCVGGALALLIIDIASWTWNADADLCAWFGVMIVGDRPGGWVAGCIAQLGIAIIAALFYAAVFEFVTCRAGAILGLVIAVPHVIIAGLAVGFIPVPHAARDFGPPGAFLEYRGIWIVIAFIVAHLVFGAVVGALYGQTRRAVPATRRVWRDVTAGPTR
jgi:hypothetical protein